MAKPGSPPFLAIFSYKLLHRRPRLCPNQGPLPSHTRSHRVPPFSPTNFLHSRPLCAQIGAPPFLVIFSYKLLHRRPLLCPNQGPPLSWSFSLRTSFIGGPCCAQTRVPPFLAIFSYKPLHRRPLLWPDQPPPFLVIFFYKLLHRRPLLCPNQGPPFPGHFLV